MDVGNETGGRRERDRWEVGQVALCTELAGSGGLWPGDMEMSKSAFGFELWFGGAEMRTIRVGRMPEGERSDP